jgi:hypothetical protein
MTVRSGEAATNPSGQVAADSAVWKVNPMCHIPIPKYINWNRSIYTYKIGQVYPINKINITI